MQVQYKMPIPIWNAFLVRLTGVLVSTVLAKPYVVDTHKKISYQVFTSAPGVDKFLGILYGKDASSKNRFAPPQAFNPPAGYIFNVNTADADCPQASGGGFLYQTNVTNISENCLNLLPAWSVQACNDTKIPVMVFIYEGKVPIFFWQERILTYNRWAQYRHSI